MSYTINPNAKNKWARNAENTMDLSLETDASSVYLDNGRTLEQELGEGSMVSNVATVDSSMSKVIDGTLDGVYESGVMYGRSLVNIKKTVEAITMTGSGQYKGFHLRSADMIQDLKTDTDYLFVVNVTSNTLEGSTQYSLDFGNTDPNNPNQQAYFTARHYLPYNALGTYKFVLRTKSSFENAVFVSRNQILPSCTGGSITFSYMLLEYQEGMENWDIPFFEGLCDVKMPILRNVGKNLLCTQDYSQKGTITNVEVTQNTLKATAEGEWHGFEYILQLKPNTEYTFSFERDSDTIRGFIRHPENKGWTGGYGGYSNYTFTTRSTGVIRFTIESSLANNTIVVRNPMIIEGSLRPISYENYKTNILHTPETVILRSLPNGVRDELNLKTGEYIKRIGEVVLDGSDDEGWRIDDITSEKHLYVDTQILGTSQTNPLTSDYRISDKFNSITHEEYLAGKEGIRYCSIPAICISKSKLSVANLDGFKQYLQQNPVTVQYQLETPIVTTIELLSIPFAYENGHIILESGFEGQSLLPTLEYSTVINLTGQIQSIANTVQKQEKQITMLEKMLIQNIINLDYNNTLLTLKNEMEEML